MSEILNLHIDWRDYESQLTREQISELEIFESERVPGLMWSPDAAVRVAANFARCNQAQSRFAHIPPPAGCLGNPSHWIEWEGDLWCRSFVAYRRVLDCRNDEQRVGHFPANISIEVAGQQNSDGTVSQCVYIDGEGLESLTANQTREFARALIAAADKLETLEGGF